MSARAIVLPTLHPVWGLEGRALYELTFVCRRRLFKAAIRARNQEAAHHEAVIELAAQCPGFEPAEARLVSSHQLAD